MGPSGSGIMILLQLARWFVVVVVVTGRCCYSVALHLPTSTQTHIHTLTNWLRRRRWIEIRILCKVLKTTAKQKSEWKMEQQMDSHTHTSPLKRMCLKDAKLCVLSHIESISFIYKFQKTKPIPIFTFFGSSQFTIVGYGRPSSHRQDGACMAIISRVSKKKRKTKLTETDFLSFSFFFLIHSYSAYKIFLADDLDDGDGWSHIDFSLFRFMAYAMHKTCNFWFYFILNILCEWVSVPFVVQSSKQLSAPLTSVQLRPALLVIIIIIGHSSIRISSKICDDENLFNLFPKSIQISMRPQNMKISK